MNDDLECFSIVQQTYYQTAFQEIKSGQKRNCWRWFVFPHKVGMDTVRLFSIMLLRIWKIIL